MSEKTAPGFNGLASAAGAELTKKALKPIVRAIRGELASARDEVRARIAGARAGIVVVVAAALFGCLSLGLLAALAVALLSLALPLWGAVAVTLGASILITGILALVGSRLVRRGVPPVPKDTLADVRDRLVKH